MISCSSFTDCIRNNGCIVQPDLLSKGDIVAVYFLETDYIISHRQLYDFVSFCKALDELWCTLNICSDKEKSDFIKNHCLDINELRGLTYLVKQRGKIPTEVTFNNFRLVDKYTYYNYIVTQQESFDDFYKVYRRHMDITAKVKEKDKWVDKKLVGFNSHLLTFLTGMNTVAILKAVGMLYLWPVSVVPMGIEAGLKYIMYNTYAEEGIAKGIGVCSNMKHHDFDAFPCLRFEYLINMK